MPDRFCHQVRLTLSFAVDDPERVTGYMIESRLLYEEGWTPAYISGFEVDGRSYLSTITRALHDVRGVQDKLPRVLPFD